MYQRNFKLDEEIREGLSTLMNDLEDQHEDDEEDYEPSESKEVEDYGKYIDEKI